MAEDKPQKDIGILERPERKVKEPEQFRVLLHNDDYTTMEFVLETLEEVFQKSPAEAYRVMMKVHLEGHGVAGIYTHEVAETKVETVHERARQNGFPLRASLEEA
jgi:ATP-dependent Clp protease adaptor protein ClpS